MNLPPCFHLTCATRWHFKDITGNWLYWIYFLTSYSSVICISRYTLSVHLNEFSQAQHVLLALISRSRILLAPRKSLLCYFSVPILIIEVPTVLTPNSIDEFYLFAALYKWNHKCILLCLASPYMLFV